MSRIGKKVLVVPAGVTVTVENNVFTAKGPKGELSFVVPSPITLEREGNEITFKRPSDEKHTRALHGLSRAMCNNCVVGVTNGFSRKLDIEGVGYRAEIKNDRLLLTLGYSHPILFIPPTGVKFETPSPTSIVVSGTDKQLVGQVAAKIRKQRPPEPYKGKGIRYSGEQILRKAGKSGKK